MKIQVYSYGVSWMWMILGPRRVDPLVKCGILYGTKKEATVAAEEFEARLYELYHSQDGHMTVEVP